MLSLLGGPTIIAILLVAPWPAQAQTGVLPELDPYLDTWDTWDTWDDSFRDRQDRVTALDEGFYTWETVSIRNWKL